MYEKHLASRDWLVGNKYSNADILSWSWIRAASWAGVEIDEFPRVREWVERIEQRPAVKEGLKVPEQDRITLLKNDPKLAEDAAREASAWIMKGMQGEGKK